ncbi:MAG: SGNH/GDSL hydrolase family protein, partial [Candidatus Promineifilaceae bacterium]
AIYARGQELGRNPNAFSKIGDSTIEALNFFARFDEVDGQSYNLGEYDYLQRTIDHYSGSFAREGFALIRGMHSWSVFDPFWADKDNCLADETVIDCEFRLYNPSVVLIRLGSNDRAPNLFDENYRMIVSYAIEQGVIPILATKPDRVEGEGDEINTSIREIAAEYKVPLWDLDKVLATLPDHGLSEDEVHMTTFYSFDYTDERAFERGHALQNLTGLIALDSVLQCVQD